jgi:hypothetical protein
MKCWLCVVLIVLLCVLVTAQGHSAPTPSKPATVMSGLGDLHHPVSTSNPQAQQFFDQGLRLIYAFNQMTRQHVRFTARQILIPGWPLPKP